MGQQQVEKPLFPAQPILPNQLRAQSREYLVMADSTGAIHHARFTKETGHQDLFEPF